jgi:parvulin-like peptidyl-prolyl isomerase
VTVVALIIALFMLTMTATSGDLVTVNGEEITDIDVSFQYNLLPESYRALFTRDQIVEQIIDETLIVQAAERSGIEVTQADVHERVQEILESNGITIADLQENLAGLNVTEEDFEMLVRRQLMISSYLEQELVLSEPDEEILTALYDLSKDQLAVPQQVTVRHVLISSQRDNAAILAKSIYDDLRAGADFCAYAQNTSDDRGSRDTCGVYTFARDFMVPEFEEASFEMVPGDFRLIQTAFGYHVIEKIDDIPASTKTYDEVRDELAQQYMSAERSAEYRRIISSLRDQATIVYANGTVLMPVQPNTLGPAVVEPTVETPEPTAEPAVEPETPIEPVVPETVAPVEPVDNTALFSCIAQKATVYGTEWSSDTRAARDLFARQGVGLPYVACDRYPDACADVTGYPTWKIDGQMFVGRMSVEQLKDAADC